MPGFFLNEITSCVDDSLIGYVRAHNHLELIGRAVIARSQVPSVAVISGNGSGHEPAMVGFVGRGLLNACISGSIFASPPSSEIFRLIIEMKRRGAKQVLMIILNYTGDRLNFGLAMERARELGIDIDMLVVADDAAMDSAMGPRGLAGALLVIKIAGALAEQGKTMSEIVDVCQSVRTHLRTIGLSASGVRVPGQPQAFELLDDEIELGMGIHGEAGAQKLKSFTSRQATDSAFGQLIRGSRSLDIKRDDDVLLFVNNLGGCSNLEMGIILKDSIESLEHRALHVKRILSGQLMTSFNMKGFSLTILKLTNELSSTILNLLDAPTDAFAWPKTISTTQLPVSTQTVSDSLEFNEQFTTQIVIDESQMLVLDAADADLVSQAIQSVIKKIHSETDKLNSLDATCGDGDTGTAFARAADALERELAEGKIVLNNLSSLFRRLGLIAESRMGGTCGAICGLFLAATAKNLTSRANTNLEAFSNAFEAGIQSVESYGRVQPGDKSVLDALIPVVDFLKSKTSSQTNLSSQDWKDLVTIADQAADATKNLVAKVGRASYSKYSDTQFVDPGAYAISIILQAISDIFSKSDDH